MLQSRVRKLLSRPNATLCNCGAYVRFAMDLVQQGFVLFAICFFWHFDVVDAVVGRIPPLPCSTQ